MWWTQFLNKRWCKKSIDNIPHGHEILLINIDFFDPFNLIKVILKKDVWLNFSHVLSSLPALKDSLNEQINKVLS